MVCSTFLLSSVTRPRLCSWFSVHYTSQWSCAGLLPCLILGLLWWISLGLRCTWIFRITCSAAAGSLMRASQGHIIPVLQSPQQPPLLLLAAISSAEASCDAVWAVNWHPVPRDTSPLPLKLLAALQMSWRCFAAAASPERFTCWGGGFLLLLLSKLGLLVGHRSLSLATFIAWCRTNSCYSLLIVYFCFALSALIFCEMVSVSLYLLRLSCLNSRPYLEKEIGSYLYLSEVF